MFDFGGVLVDSPFDAFRAVEERSGASADAIRAINSRNPDDNAWARIERGEIDADEFARQFTAEAGALGFRIDGHEVLAALAQVSPAQASARAAMLDALQRCRAAGVRLALITNNVTPLGADPDAAWIGAQFDVVTESCVLGLRKPEPAIYERTLAQLGVRAPRSVMLDDLGINLKPARALGMHTIKVIDPVAAVAELDALLG